MLDYWGACRMSDLNWEKLSNDEKREIEVIVYAFGIYCGENKITITPKTKIWAGVPDKTRELYELKARKHFENGTVEFMQVLYQGGAL
jgi:hypothetical protein